MFIFFVPPGNNRFSSVMWPKWGPRHVGWGFWMHVWHTHSSHAWHDPCMFKYVSVQFALWCHHLCYWHMPPQNVCHASFICMIWPISYEFVQICHLPSAYVCHASFMCLTLLICNMAHFIWPGSNVSGSGRQRGASQTAEGQVEFLKSQLATKLPSKTSVVLTFEKFHQRPLAFRQRSDPASVKHTCMKR